MTNVLSTGKKTKGRKRQIATDDIGCLSSVVVHRANQHDTMMGIWAAIFAWLNNSRRLSKDYKIRTASAKTMIKLSHIHTLLKRL